MNLEGRIVIVTGGAGMLGKRYLNAIREINGIPVSLDINYHYLDERKYEHEYICDITKEEEVINICKKIKGRYGKPIYGLINNAAIDPKFDKESLKPLLSLYPIDHFMKEIEVGLKGALICTKIFGDEMCKNQTGSIINISSLLGVVAPNQNFYRELQAIKPVGYTVVKHAIIGLTRHTATEWAHHNVRCNALAPNGVYNNHPQEFVDKLTKYIPLGRMADQNEYNEAIKFLLTDASKFMTGQTLVIDGGASIW